ncbi:MAG: hypothetical protein ACRDGE_00825 [Candidatus Limnocylindria bacterium]
MRKIGVILVVFGVIVALGLATPVFAQTQVCTLVDRSSKEVIPGVFLRWDSSFLCADAPDRGTYEFTVQVLNRARSAEAVRINRLRLIKTTPCPRGNCPAATGEASGLPIRVAPGQRRSFTVSGTYKLVKTDEGKKANLHFTAFGKGVRSGKSFKLGINAHFRAPGVAPQ